MAKYWHLAIVGNGRKLPVTKDGAGPDELSDFPLDFAKLHQARPLLSDCVRGYRDLFVAFYLSCMAAIESHWSVFVREWVDRTDHGGSLGARGPSFTGENACRLIVDWRTLSERMRGGNRTDRRGTPALFSAIIAAKRVVLVSVRPLPSVCQLGTLSVCFPTKGLETCLRILNQPEQGL